MKFDIPFELFQLSPRPTSLRVRNAAEAKLGRLMCQVHTQIINNFNFRIFKYSNFKNNLIY